MEKTLDFSKIIETLQGQPFKDENGEDLKVGIVISQTLCNSTSDEPSRAISIAKKVRECNAETILEPHDIEYIKKVIAANKSINIVQVQIDEVLG